MKFQTFLEQKLFLLVRTLYCMFLFHSIVHKKPLREVEIAAICHDALQVSMNFIPIDIN